MTEKNTDETMQQIEATRLLRNMERHVLAAAATEMSSSDTHIRLNSRLSQSLADAVGLSVDFKGLTSVSPSPGT
jgi:hypothetical protein